MEQPHYGVWPTGWRFVETINVQGLDMDCFCIGNSFHINVSNALPGIHDPGWHVSVKPKCDHRNYDRVPTHIWMPEVKRFFREAQVERYKGSIPSEVGLDVFHFHENIALRASRN